MINATDAGAGTVSPTRIPSRNNTAAGQIIQTQNTDQRDANVTTHAGANQIAYIDGQGSSARFYNPYIMSGDGLGNLYLLETPIPRSVYPNSINADICATIRKITPDGTVATIFESDVNRLSLANGGIAADRNGNIYYTTAISPEYTNIQLKKLSASGTETLIADRLPILNCNRITCTPSGLVYLITSIQDGSPTAKYRIIRISNEGALSDIATIDSNFEKIISEHVSVATDNDDNLYICYRTALNNYSLARISKDGNISPIISEIYGDYAWFPSMAVDSNKNIFLSNSPRHSIMRVNASGIMERYAGTGERGYRDGAASQALFAHPWGISVDNNGNVFVADNGNRCIRKITPASVASSLSVQTPYFSPNLPEGDGHLDNAVIRVECDSYWALSVVGHGEIATGSGYRDLLWNGQINGQALPDGEYALKLTSGSIEKTATVVIDTRPPSAEVMVEGRSDPGVLDTIVPKFTLKLSDELSKFDGVKAIEKIYFPKRRDGVIPRIYDNAKSYDPSTESFTYEVPFEEDSILFFGSQRAEFTIRDRAGNQRDVAVFFAIGEENLYSGLPFDNFEPIAATGYRVQSLTDEAAANRVHPDLANNGKVIRVKSVSLYPDAVKHGVTPNQTTNVVKLSRSVSLFGRVFPVTAIVFQLFDLVSDSPKAYIETPSSFEFFVPRIGRIILDKNTWSGHITGPNKHTEVDFQSMVNAMVALRDSYDDVVEVWEAIKPAYNDRQRDLLIIYQKAGPMGQNILLIPISLYKQSSKKGLHYGPGNYNVNTAHYPGVWNGDLSVLNGNISSYTNDPAILASNLSFSRVYQWSHATKLLAEFDKNPQHLWFGSSKNPVPLVSYQVRRIGNIADSVKPYTIVNNLCTPTQNMLIIPTKQQHPKTKQFHYQ